jgi:hypothetical protein
MNVIFVHARARRGLGALFVCLPVVLAGCGAAAEGRAVSSYAPVAARTPTSPAPEPSPTPAADAPSTPREERSVMGYPAPGAPAQTGSSGARGDGKPTATGEARDAQFLVYTARLTMSVYQVDQGLTTVEQAARDLGGFLASRGDREITIRVPRGRFDEALKRVEQTGEVTHRDVKAEDVTDEFTDLEVRLKNARAMRDRLDDLLKKAPVKEALEIEKELGRVTQELERIEGRLKLLRDKLAYSTVTVSFQARGPNLEARATRLPFPWLGQLGLPSLMNLAEEK